MAADSAKVDGFRILQCVEWLRDKVEISGLQPVNTNLNDDQRREIVDFLVSEIAGRLFIFVDGPGRDLIIQNEVPPAHIQEFFYLVRRVRNSYLLTTSTVAFLMGDSTETDKVPSKAFNCTWRMCFAPVSSKTLLGRKASRKIFLVIWEDSCPA
jgi:hypothetical protein